jgi:hypothetical protein
MKALLWCCKSIALALQEHCYELTGGMVWEIKKVSEIEIPDG